MIAIVSSHARERNALGALCVQQGWSHESCDSLRAFRKLLTQIVPRSVVTRRKLTDGFSDDILALVAQTSRVIVLYPADLPAADATRQVALGADCVLRDPVRTELLLAYLARFNSARPAARPPQAAPKAFRFAGALVDPVTRTLERDGRRTALTPRELELVQLLEESGDSLISYQNLYHEILGRPFRGDTSNMRVLLGKLDISFRRIGVALRDCVAVIPKSGYRCVRREPAQM